MKYLKSLGKIFAASFGVAGGVGVAVSADQSGFTVDHLLRLLEMVISWPVAVSVVALALMLRHRDALNALLQHPISLKVGNVELQVRQPSPQDRSPEDTKLPSDAESQVLSPEEGVHSPAPTDRQMEKELLRSALKRSFFWQFRYLDVFLVPHTKQVLRWIASASPALNAFHEVWGETIPLLAERQAILDALIRNDLVVHNNSALQATNLGRAYLWDVGLLREPPSAAS